MLDEGVIQPSKSPWSSPFFLIKKKDGSLRPVVDYHDVNAVTRTDIYPLPRLEEYLDSLADVKYFSTLDLKSGYWQIAMDPNSVEKTAFSCPEGHFQFTVMPFGLKNAPADFQRLMELVLHGLNWQICLVYIDDIIVFSKDLTTHLERLGAVFKAIADANLKLKPKKCHILKKEVEFLGHIISENGILPDPKKTKVLEDYAVPKNVKQVQKFMGLVQWFRRFIPNLANIARPLYELLKKEVSFEMTDERIAALEKLRECLIKPPIVSFSMFGENAQFILYTDASNYALGAVLAQEQDGRERVLYYASR